MNEAKDLAALPSSPQHASRAILRNGCPQLADWSFGPGRSSSACYVFSASQDELGAEYALGHALLCMGLATVMLLGIMIVPLLVRRDIARSRWESTDQDGYGQI